MGISGGPRPLCSQDIYDWALRKVFKRDDHTPCKRDIISVEVNLLHGCGMQSSEFDQGAGRLVVDKGLECADREGSRCLHWVYECRHWSNGKQHVFTRLWLHEAKLPHASTATALLSDMGLAGDAYIAS